MPALDYTSVEIKPVDYKQEFEEKLNLLNKALEEKDWLNVSYYAEELSDLEDLI